MTTATECPTSAELRAFSLGELGDEDSDELFRHVQQCPKCKSEMETVEDVEDSLIAILRSPDNLRNFVDEPQCRVAVVKALGALAAAGDSPTATDFSDMPKAIGEYELVRPLGRGGMGSVYLARHTKLGREVALKILAGHRLADPRMRERFDAEMRAVGRLSHPNIVTAHDAREVDGTAVLVTEYIEGYDLGEVVSRTGPLEIADACEIVGKVAVALQYTSDQGFVHRDVKPSNIMLSRSGEVKLLDLGLARLQMDDNDRAEITCTGQAMGTADYVAPEQVADSRSVDVRADIYSLGCTLFKLLTGNAPFTGPGHANAFAKMSAHVSSDPPSLGDVKPNSPARLVKLVDSMLAKQPGDRPQAPIVVAEALKPLSREADLEQLARRVASAEEPPPRQTSDAPSSQGTPAAKPWYRRRVPMSAAIAAGLLGVLIGLCLGMVVTITYSDGTQVRIPITPGTKVHFEHEEEAQPSGAQVGGTQVGGVETGPADMAYSPLHFVVLLEESSLTPESLEAARQRLQDSEGGDSVSTEAGTWYRVQDDVSVPVSAAHRRYRYALASNRRDEQITWGDLQGHILGGQSNGYGIELRFDDKLAEQMSELTGRNMNRQLAILIDRQIVSSPFIRSKLTNATRITGDFSREQSMYLMQEIQRGLINPIQRKPAQADTDTSFESRVQGVWTITGISVEAGMGNNGLKGVVAFNEDRFCFLLPGVSESLSVGTFKLGVGDKQVTIEFEDLTSQNLNGNLETTLQFLPDGKLQLQHRITQPQAGVTSVMEMQLQRLGEFPRTEQEWLTVFTGDQKLSSSNVDTLGRVFVFMRTGAISEELRQEFAGKYEDAKSRVDTVNHLKQIGLAFHDFHAVYRRFPGSSNRLEGSRGVNDKQRIQPFSWRVAILPFIEQSALYEQYRFDEPWDSESNLKLLDQMPAAYRSRYADSDQPPGSTNLQGFATEDSVLGTAGGHRVSEILDGTSQTLLILESAESVPWTKPQDLDEIPRFIEGQPIHLLMADGSVVSRENIDEALLKKLITRGGGELVDLDTLRHR